MVAASLLFLAAAAALSAAARLIPGFAQSYSTTVYPALVSSIGKFAGKAGFSVAEALCIILPVILIADIIVQIRRLRRARADRQRRPGTFPARLLLLISFLIFLYSANCNVNYYRDPFVSAQIYTYAQFTQDTLEEFCEFTLTQLEKSSENLAASGAKTFHSFYPEGNGLSHSAIAAMTSLSGRYPALRGFYPHPKQLTVLSRFFSMMGVSGIYSPFTIEANINGEMPGMEKPFTACHELSHLRGFMNEGEANFIGWLACIGSGDPAFERSGWLIAWNYAAGSLRAADPDAFARLASRLPADVIAELQDNHNFWETHENKASEIQDQLNDTYLKSNGQKEGIQSYGRLTTLMLLWYRGMI